MTETARAGDTPSDPLRHSKQQVRRINDADDAVTQKSVPRTGPGFREAPQANSRGDVKVSQKITGLPQLHSAAEVAQALGCSEWWVKEQARRRRIPFIRSGGGYRFTRQHVEEIFALLEERPSEPTAPERRDPTVRRRTPSVSETPAVRLRARPPRRAQRAA
ncbi:helix-turn-helix domain-containing protein [Streptomyces sp. PTD9-10]|uniref:helix-turn-helix domain-containing protein n=1 Tax=Streptomyces sp. PTD9-10 TaxID=3120151 RepID=UPI003008B83D